MTIKSLRGYLKKGLHVGHTLKTYTLYGILTVSLVSTVKSIKKNS